MKRPRSKHWAYTNKRESTLEKVSVGWKNLDLNHQKLGEDRVCSICQKSYYARRASLVKGYALFCGKVCYGISRRGQDRFSSNYKGDKVGYVGLHAWVKRKLGKPNFCEGCGTEEAYQFEWANISGEYKRDLEDWIRLCIPCHRRMDKNIEKMYMVLKQRNAIV